MFFREVHFKVLDNQEPVVPEAIMKDTFVDFDSDVLSYVVLYQFYNILSNYGI